jgi:hypothetical protein
VIEDYLLTTRGEGYATSVRPEFAAHYARTAEGIVAILRCLVDDSFKQPSLIVTYSSFMHTECVSLAGEKSLIYDQYLGQVLNRLNRLWFEDAPPDQVDVYLAKLFALRYLRSERRPRAIEYAATYYANRAMLAKPDPKTAGARGKFTAIQEAFVLAHEIAHSIYDSNDHLAASWRSSFFAGVEAWGEIEQQLEEQHLGPDSQWRRQEIVAALGRERERAYRRRFGIAGSDAELDKLLEEKRRKDDSEESFDSMPLDLQTLNSSARVTEECTCDHVAARLATLWAQITLGAGTATALAACFLAMHHLRLLRYIDVHAERGGRIVAGEKRSVWAETATRLRAFRCGALGRVQQECDPDVVSEAFDGLREVNEQHYKVIMDQVLEDLFDESMSRSIAIARERRLVDGILKAHDAQSAVLFFCDLK